MDNQIHDERKGNTDEQKQLILFLAVSFLLPLLMAVICSNIPEGAVSFLLYGIEAAAPTIAALAVFRMDNELRQSFRRMFVRDQLITAIIYPTALCSAVMLMARLIFCAFTGGFSSFFGHITKTQLIMILWSLVAEEIGWRGYLQPQLERLGIKKSLAPCIVGVIWCAWHYHFFIRNGIEVPIFIFLLSCIIESYIYGFLLRITKGQLLSAMIFHFMYNLLIHIAAVSPSDNGGNTAPYIIMTVLEAAAAVICCCCEHKAGSR